METKELEKQLREELKEELTIAKINKESPVELSSTLQSTFNEKDSKN